ncbi:MAG: type IIL restriction-modification enzyme MmeI [Pseudomonadales bacterium]
MHNAWMRAIAVGLMSRYRYFWYCLQQFPMAENLTKSKRKTIETAAQAVLDARAQFPDASLADLYDPLTMPLVLLKAHQALDKVVDAAYGKTNFQNWKAGA